jgi:hypothetical protein
VSRARFAGVVLLLTAAASCLAPAAAHATAVSAAEFRTLAGEAADDRGALEELRQVDSVDGKRVDVRGALRGARGEALDARLQALAALYTELRSAGDPRAQARDVLAESRFHQAKIPGPFTGILEWIGDRLPSFDVPLDWLDDLLPGGRSVVWIFLAAVCGGLGWAISRRLLTSRVRASTQAEQALAAARDEDPRGLDRRADAAEAAGDLEAALRLRFRAGLLRLDERGTIEFRPSISTYEVRRALHSEDFDTLASTFDDVVYGGRPPEDEDLAAARERWPTIIKGSDPFRNAS